MNPRNQSGGAVGVGSGAVLGHICHDCGKTNLKSRYVFNGLTRCDECGDAIIKGVKSLLKIAQSNAQSVVAGSQFCKPSKDAWCHPYLFRQMKNPEQN